MATISWKSGVSGDWTTKVDWSGGVAPGSADDVTIGVGGDYTVTVSSADAAHSLILEDATATLALNSGGALMISTTLALTAGAKVAVGESSTLAIGGAVTNAGAISATNATLTFSSAVVNSGAITATNCSIGFSAGLPTGGGTFNVANSQVYIGGTVKTSALAPFDGQNDTLTIEGVLDNSGASLDLGAGSSLGTVSLTGTISGGTIVDSGGGLVVPGDVNGMVTFDGVSFHGTLDLTIPASGLYVTSKGLTLRGASGTGRATLDVGGALGDVAFIAFEGSQTVNNATINLGTGSVLFEDDIDDSGDTLTFGKNVTINQIGGSGIIFVSQFSDQIVSYATINALQSGGSFAVSTFVNKGRINIANGDSFHQETSLEGGSEFDNAVDGRITVGQSSAFESFGFTYNYGTIIANGATLVCDAFSNFGTFTANNCNIYFGSATLEFVNTGTLNISNSTVEIASNLTTAALAPLENQNDTLTIGGVLDNTGATLVVGAGSAFGTVAVSGTISGGVVDDTGGGLSVPTYANLTLDGVTYEGALSLAGYTSALIIGSKGLIARGAGGVGRGTLNLGVGELVFDGSQSFNNAAINLSVGSQTNMFVSGVGATLTLGSQAVVTMGSGNGLFGGDGDTIVNKGSINATGGSIFFSGSVALSNQGTLEVGNGHEILLPALFSNFVEGVLSGGDYKVYAGSTLRAEGGSNIVVDAATIILSGAGSVLENQTAVIDSTLATIAATGTLELLAGRDWTASQKMTNAGKLVLGGGTFAPASLTEAKGSTLTGYGTIDTGGAAIDNAGLIVAAGPGTLMIVSAIDNTGNLSATTGALVVEGAVTGVGEVRIGAGSADFRSDFKQRVLFVAGSTGTLELGKSQTYGGTISGFSTTGATTLDLDGVAFGAKTVASYSGTASGGTLTVTDGTHTAHIKLAGNYLGSTFTVAGDGHGGTKVVDVASGSVALPTRLAFVAGMAGLGRAAGEPTPIVHHAETHAGALTRPHLATA